MMVCREIMKDFFGGGNGFGVSQINIPLKIVTVVTFWGSQRDIVGSTKTYWEDAWRFFVIAEPNENMF